MEAVSVGASSTPSESVVVGRILDMTPGVDVPDELEERWSRSFATLSSLTQKASPAEVQDMLQKRVSSSDSLCAEVFAGLLFGILSANSTKEAEALLEHINLLVLNTGFKALSSELEQLMSCFARHRLLHSSRMMLLWLTSQLAPRGVPCFPALCGSLLRQCYAGDLSSNNLDFTKAFLRLVEEHKEVIFAEPKLVMAILYVCLCLIPDHCSSSSEALKSPMTSTLVEMEGKMACDILEEKGEACVELGRDLIRCLEGAAKFHEGLRNQFQPLEQAGILRLSAQTLTQKWIPPFRLSVEMELHIMFFMQEIKLGDHRRYQSWFTDRHLSRPGWPSLVPDLIRFVCVSFHPTNQQLRQNLVPRWFVIGWLMDVLLRGHEAEFRTARKVLFLDWVLSGDKVGESIIMNIEPGILLMVKSLGGHAHISLSMLDHLVEQSRQPAKRDSIIRCMKLVLHYRVIQLAELHQLLNCAEASPEARAAAMELFKDCLQGDSSGSISQQGSSSSAPPKTSGSRHVPSASQGGPPPSRRNMSPSLPPQSGGPPSGTPPAPLSPLSSSSTSAHPPPKSKELPPRTPSPAPPPPPSSTPSTMDVDPVQGGRLQSALTQAPDKGDSENTGAAPSNSSFENQLRATSLSSSSPFPPSNVAKKLSGVPSALVHYSPHIDRLVTAMEGYPVRQKFESEFERMLVPALKSIIGKFVERAVSSDTSSSEEGDLALLLMRIGNIEWASLDLTRRRQSEAAGRTYMDALMHALPPEGEEEGPCTRLLFKCRELEPSFGFRCFYFLLRDNRFVSLFLQPFSHDLVPNWTALNEPGKIFDVYLKLLRKGSEADDVLADAEAALFEDPDVGTLFCKCMIHLLELFDDIDAMAALFQILSLLNVEQFSELLQEVGSGKLIPFIINEDEDLVFQFLERSLEYDCFVQERFWTMMSFTGQLDAISAEQLVLFALKHESATVLHQRVAQFLQSCRVLSAPELDGILSSFLDRMHDLQSQYRLQPDSSHTDSKARGLRSLHTFMCTLLGLWSSNAEGKDKKQLAGAIINTIKEGAYSRKLNPLISILCYLRQIGVEKSPLLENPKVNEEIRSLASRRLLEKESLRILLPDSSPSSPSGGSGSGALFSPPGSQSPSKKLPLSGVRRKRTLEEMQEDEEGDGNGLEGDDFNMDVSGFQNLKRPKVGGSGGDTSSS